MAKIIFISGGARSGKSSFAQQYAARVDSQVLYIATAVAFDEEMAARIAKHKEDRPTLWRTVEAPIGVDRVLARAAEPVALLDCLTILINNILWPLWQEDDDNRNLSSMENTVMAAVDGILNTDYQGILIIVSNELGMGLVPENSLARFFRDMAGWANQRIAACADEVYFMVSGIPMRIK